MAVAQRSGFNYLSLFNTCFKRRFGMSPGQWSKSLSGAKAIPPALASGNPNCLLRSNGLCPWSAKLTNKDSTIGV